MKSLQEHLALKRYSSVTVLQVVDGLIWVYGSCEPGAEEEAASKSIESRRLPKKEKSISIPWFMRDLPYGVETLLENVSDCNLQTLYKSSNIPRKVRQVLQNEGMKHHTYRHLAFWWS